MSEPPHYPPPGSPPSGWSQPPGQYPGWGQPTGQPPSGRGSSRLVLVVVAAVAVVGGAVVLLVTSGDRSDGGGDPPTVELSTEEQEYAGAIADSGSRDTPGMDDAMADCVGAATVEVVGIDVLRDAVTLDELRYSTLDSLREFGVTLDEPEVAELARRFDECGDWMDVLVDVWAQAEQTPEVLECLTENLTEETLAYATAAGFAGTQELSDSVEQTAEEVIQLCVPGAGGLGG
jgi:hypothetical protein